MYFSDTVTLRSVETSQNANGHSVQVVTDTDVFANVKSASRSEFYAANRSGVDASYEIEVYAEDWGNQTQVVYDGKIYSVVRAYQKGLGIVSLTCSDKAV